MSSENTSNDERRAEYTAGLRALADLLDEHPELILPYDGTSSPIAVIPYTADEQRDQLAAWARAVPGTKAKSAAHDGTQFYLDLKLRGLSVKLICKRADVCERVVTCTREVVKTVPDPDALAAVPVVEVTETVEDVEWVCRPLLAEGAVES